jgi:hypothetical protein
MFDLLEKRTSKKCSTSARARRSAMRNAVETLEPRTMFSLLGIEPGFPVTSYFNVDNGATTYNHTTDAFDVTSTPSEFVADSNYNLIDVTGNANMQIHIKVDNSGNLLGNNAANGFAVTGTIVDGNTTYTGTLLTGSVSAFGYQANGGESDYDARFTVTGGTMAALYAGSDIGVVLHSENSTFTDFTTDSSGNAKGSFGSIPSTGQTPPTISISGKKVLDLTGNGESSDDTGMGGVTINLYTDTNKDGKLDAGDTLVTSTVSATGTGAYSFTGLAPATYFVSEVNPSGYLETGPSSITINAANVTTNTSYTGNDFADYQLNCNCCLSDMSCVKYTVVDTCGCVHTYSSLDGNVKQGDEVIVSFNAGQNMVGHTLTLVSYTAPDSYFNASDASQQQIFDQDTETVVAGQNQLVVQIPNCDFQVDFVCGYAINTLGANGNSNIFYHAQNRFIDGDNGGTCAPSSTNVGTGSLSGYVWDDSANNNGVKNTGEAGIGGVEVKLTASNGATFYRLTDTDGSYSFKGLTAGKYSITEVTQPAGYNDGKDSLGTLGGTLGNDAFTAITVGTGAIGLNYNFGEIKASSICGNLNYSCGGHNYCCSGDKITLSGCDDKGNKVSCTTTCDSNGNYCFTGLRTGCYTISDCSWGTICTSTAACGTNSWSHSFSSCSNAVSTLLNLLKGFFC